MNQYEPNEGDQVVYSDLHEFAVWRGRGDVVFYKHSDLSHVGTYHDAHIVDFDDAQAFAYDLSEED